MKKYILPIILTSFLFCGCNQKVITCSLDLNEDDAISKHIVNYTFNIFGKQLSRIETNTVTFSNLEDCNYYYNYISSLYNGNNEDLNYEITKDETSFTVNYQRVITNKQIDKSLLKELTPKASLNKKKIKKYYEQNGYTCK